MTGWTRADRVAPTWDDNGNLTCDGRTDHQVFGTSTRLHFEYDYRNHLRRVSDDQDRTVAAYEYDGLNRRVRKTTLDAEEAVTSDVWYLWHGWQCVEERDLNAAGQPVLRQHVYGPGYVDHHAALVDAQGATYYYLQDRMANVVALADATGVVVERYAYEPYGGVTITDETGQTVRSSSSYGNAYAFTGRYWDAEAGLYYFRNRWYSPDLGRFTSRDPMGYVDGGSLYAYALGSPARLADAMGLTAIEEPADKVAFAMQYMYAGSGDSKLNPTYGVTGMHAESYIPASQSWDPFRDPGVMTDATASTEPNSSTSGQQKPQGGTDQDPNTGTQGPNVSVTVTREPSKMEPTAGEEVVRTWQALEYALNMHRTHIAEVVKLREEVVEANTEVYNILKYQDFVRTSYAYGEIDERTMYADSLGSGFDGRRASAKADGLQAQLRDAERLAQLSLASVAAAQREFSKAVKRHVQESRK